MSMATQVWRGVARSWRSAASKSSRGRLIYQALKNELDTTPAFWQIVEANAGYIKTMPLQIAERVTAKMAKGYAEGKRPEELLKQVLADAPHLTRSHARLIARTETSKASTALTRVRAEAAGLSWYVWRTSKDERVRSSHDHMDGVVVSWADPPSPEALDPRHTQRPYGEYHAGETFNCRCYPAPLLSYDDVSWPARVYYGGRLQRMTLAKFKAITGGEL